MVMIKHCIFTPCINDRQKKKKKKKKEKKKKKTIFRKLSNAEYLLFQHAAIVFIDFALLLIWYYLYPFSKYLK